MYLKTILFWIILEYLLFHVGLKMNSPISKKKRQTNKNQCQLNSVVTAYKFEIETHLNK